MIIIVDAFERTRPGAKVEVRLSESMAVSGSAITVTSLTSALVFFTAIWVDFPALTNFCVPAGFCVLCVYILQIFFFGGCLVLDTQRQEAGRADLLPCFTPESDEAAAYCAPRGARPAQPAPAGRKAGILRQYRRPERPLQTWFRTTYPAFLLRPRTRAAVVLGFLAPVLLAASQIPSITVGLPLRSTLAESSPVLRYVDDLEAFWKGAQTQEVRALPPPTRLPPRRPAAREPRGPDPQPRLPNPHPNPPTSRTLPGPGHRRGSSTRTPTSPTRARCTGRTRR